MNTNTSQTPRPQSAVLLAATRAARAIPPAWPLASSVAVNPFLGQSSEGLATAGARLARIAGASVTMPRSWRRRQISTGFITDQDLEASRLDAPAPLRPADLAALKAEFSLDIDIEPALPTIADLAAEVANTDWPGIIADRLGAWAAGYFDEGQALWAAPRGKSAYAAWRAVATHDLTPEILGLSGFARHVADAPESAAALIEKTAQRLGLSDTALETYFHQLLSTLGGWAQYGRYRLWQAERSGGADEVIIDLLAIRLVFEDALFLKYAPDITAKWTATCKAHEAPVTPTQSMTVDAILQDAAERALQRDIARRLDATTIAVPAERPSLMAAFCIDVRSEVFRRALESVETTIQTLGFAGFFGLPTAYTPFASDVEELRLPVLLAPTLHACAGGKDEAVSEQTTRIKARAERAWGRFKLAAVSSFAFVEATGPVYAGKLLSDALGLSGKKAGHAPAPRFDPPLDLASRLDLAERVLRAMSLLGHFAPLVILAGHGAKLANNPHASGLQCGACGGASGEINARLLASILNDGSVRQGLEARGIVIPTDTVFLAALHDTTSDKVHLYSDDVPSPSHKFSLHQVQAWFDEAGRRARLERAGRLPSKPQPKTLKRRGRDWAQLRPEWGLAGCNAFIAAPRSRTAGKDFAGRAFLHDYDWRLDEDYKVLELILTAPVLVANWISLQYYGSTVAPDIFGGGDKLLANVTGGIGVLEGNGGPLRFGLPRQSVHDGADYIHDPLRLTVCIQAPKEAIGQVLAQHHSVRVLFDNRWMHLLTLEDTGSPAWRYIGDLGWKAFEAA